MNFLGLSRKLQPIHIHWIYYLNDPFGYQKVRYNTCLSFSYIALYDREKTLKKAKEGGWNGYWDVKSLIKLIEDADK